MIAPEGKHNAQFCLNGMHWLSGLLDPGPPTGASAPR